MKVSIGRLLLSNFDRKGGLIKEKLKVSRGKTSCELRVTKKKGEAGSPLLGGCRDNKEWGSVQKPSLNEEEDA